MVSRVSRAHAESWLVRSRSQLERLENTSQTWSTAATAPRPRIRTHFATIYSGPEIIVKKFGHVHVYPDINFFLGVWTGRTCLPLGAVVAACVGVATNNHPKTSPQPLRAVPAPPSRVHVANIATPLVAKDEDIRGERRIGWNHDHASSSMRDRIYRLQEATSMKRRGDAAKERSGRGGFLLPEESIDSPHGTAVEGRRCRGSYGRGRISSLRIRRGPCIRPRSLSHQCPGLGRLEAAG